MINMIMVVSKRNMKWLTEISIYIIADVCSNSERTELLISKIHIRTCNRRIICKSWTITTICVINLIVNIRTVFVS